MSLYRVKRKAITRVIHFTNDARLAMTLPRARRVFKPGDVFEPTEAELQAFGDNLEPVDDNVEATPVPLTANGGRVIEAPPGFEPL